MTLPHILSLALIALVAVSAASSAETPAPAIVPAPAARAPAAVAPAALPPPAPLPPRSNHPADAFAPSHSLGSGYNPALALDVARRRLHLVYVDQGRVLYRTGPLDGELSSPEPVFAAEFYDTGSRPWNYGYNDSFDPHLELDAEGAPHLVLNRGLWAASIAYYTNRIGGTWRKPLRFPEESTGVNRSSNAHLALGPGGSVYLTSFSFKPVNNYLSRVDPKPSTPRLLALVPTPFGFGNAALFFTPTGELWMFGGHHGNKPWQLLRFDPVTLAPIGDPLNLAPLQGEQARASIDHTGEIHAAAGRLWGAEDHTTIGWYNNATRARAGLPPLRFFQHLGHACGGALPVRDRLAANRVYIFSWSGKVGNKHNEIATVSEKGEIGHWQLFPESQLRFTRIEDGAVAAEHQPVIDLPGAHGPAFRNTPAAVAHPEGGVLLVLCRSLAAERGAPTELRMVRVGIAAGR